MNPPTDFDSTNPANGSSIPFDFSLPPSTHHTIYHHLALLREHIHRLHSLALTAHPLAEEQPPAEDILTQEIMAVTTPATTYQLSTRPLIEPLDGQPMVLGAEKYLARVKEHVELLGRLGARKYAIRRVRERLAKVHVRKGGVRRDPRFGEREIEALAKDVG
jgi:hypothetical protein